MRTRVKSPVPAPVSEKCDGTCLEPFLVAMRAHFGPDAQIPICLRMVNGKVTEVLEQPVVTTGAGRKQKRIYIRLPFCGLCGKANS